MQSSPSKQQRRSGVTDSAANERSADATDDVDPKDVDDDRELRDGLSPEQKAEARRRAADRVGHPDKRECNNCGESYFPPNVDRPDATSEAVGAGDRFCSDDCEYEAAAKSMIATIRFDHRYCANCFRQIREVEPPGRPKWSNEWDRRGGPPDCAIGRAYPYPHALIGHVDALTRDDDGELIVDKRKTRRTGTVCSCGVGHHTHSGIQDPLGFETFKEYLKNLADSLDDLYGESLVSYAHGRETLLEHGCEMKRQPSEQFRDRDIFIRALKIALRAPTVDG